MKVALYYPWLYVKSGAERTIVELVKRSRHDWTLLTNRYEPESTFPELAGMRVVELGDRVSVKRSIRTVVAVGARLLGQRLPLQGHDALLVVCEGLGDFVTFRNRSVPVACLCLTPLRAVFDPHYRAGYLAMKGGGVLRRALLAALSAGYRWLDRRAWTNYGHVIAISREVRARILAGGLCPEDRIDVAYPGIDVTSVVRGGEAEPMFLIPGRIMWTKNLELGIDAFRAFRDRRPEHAGYRLVIAGFVDSKSEVYLRRLRQRAADCPGVSFVESPSDEALFALYRSAFAVLYPPFNEDWGIVPLEAMAHGKPVVAVNRGGPRESVLDGETGFLVEPSAGAFADAMEALVADPGSVIRFGAEGRRQAARFDWTSFTRHVDDVVERLVRARAPVEGASVPTTACRAREPVAEEP